LTVFLYDAWADACAHLSAGDKILCRFPSLVVTRYSPRGSEDIPCCLVFAAPVLLEPALQSELLAQRRLETAQAMRLRVLRGSSEPIEVRGTGSDGEVTGVLPPAVVELPQVPLASSNQYVSLADLRRVAAAGGKGRYNTWGVVVRYKGHPRMSRSGDWYITVEVTDSALSQEDDCATIMLFAQAQQQRLLSQLVRGVGDVVRLHRVTAKLWQHRLQLTGKINSSSSNRVVSGAVAFHPKTCPLSWELLRALGTVASGAPEQQERSLDNLMFASGHRPRWRKRKLDLMREVADAEVVAQAGDGDSGSVEEALWTISQTSRNKSWDASRQLGHVDGLQRWAFEFLSRRDRRGLKTLGAEHKSWARLSEVPVLMSHGAFPPPAADGPPADGPLPLLNQEVVALVLRVRVSRWAVSEDHDNVPCRVFLTLWDGSTEDSTPQGGGAQVPEHCRNTFAATRLLADATSGRLVLSKRPENPRVDTLQLLSPTIEALSGVVSQDDETAASSASPCATATAASSESELGARAAASVADALTAAKGFASRGTRLLVVVDAASLQFAFKETQLMPDVSLNSDQALQALEGKWLRFRNLCNFCDLRSWSLPEDEDEQRLAREVEAEAKAAGCQYHMTFNSESSIELLSPYFPEPHRLIDEYDWRRTEAPQAHRGERQQSNTQERNAGSDGRPLLCVAEVLGLPFPAVVHCRATVAGFTPSASAALLRRDTGQGQYQWLFALHLRDETGEVQATASTAVADDVLLRGLSPLDRSPSCAEQAAQRLGEYHGRRCDCAIRVHVIEDRRHFAILRLSWVQGG